MRRIAIPSRMNPTTSANHPTGLAVMVKAGGIFMISMAFTSFRSPQRHAGYVSNRAVLSQYCSALLRFGAWDTVASHTGPVNICLGCNWDSYTPNSYMSENLSVQFPVRVTAD